MTYKGYYFCIDKASHRFCFLADHVHLDQTAKASQQTLISEPISPHKPEPLGRKICAIWHSVPRYRLRYCKKVLECKSYFTISSSQNSSKRLL